MIMHQPAAASPLHGLVDLLWYLEISPDSAAATGHEKVLPTGTIEFVFSLNGDLIHLFTQDDVVHPVVLSGAIVCGPHSRYFILQGERHGRIAGVHFKPAGAYAWLQGPASRLANRHVNLSELFGNDATALREQLSELASAETVFAQLEAFLVAYMNGKKRPSPAVAALMQALEADPYSNPLQRVQRQCGLTSKGLSDACKREVGLTPKKIARVLRFQEVLKQVNAGQKMQWVDVALRCGYYDQAHFVRDFREFSGFSPVEYLARAGANKNHVAME